jgi:uncharacterized membrane protein
MGTSNAFLKGALVGAGTLYFFDPRMGNRRRALVADQFRRLTRKAECAVDAGVRDLRNRTQGFVHDVESFADHGNWPGSQQRSSQMAPRSMPPAARLASAACGTALMANCLVRRTPSAALWGTLGFVMFGKAIDAGPKGILVEKTLDIDAPREKVFDFFTHPNNWMRVSDVVTNVEVFDDGRFAKTLLIAGIPLRFEERFVHCKDNCLIETKSEPSSVMKFSKHMTLEEMGNGCTRLRMSFHYHPPGGRIGHAIASAFGIDAKTVLTDLLIRAKYFIETGREPHDAMSRRKSQVQDFGSNQGNGRPGSQMQGAGAPAEDIRQPSTTPIEQPSPWPESETVGSPAVSSEHFPAAID